MSNEALRVSTVIPASPQVIYFAWLDGAQHSAFTGGKATVDPSPGGKFTAWDGYIEGKNITLELGRRIVQSWRTTEFPKGAPDSRLEVHLEAVSGGTRVTLLHSEIPEGQGELYKSGWAEHYFNPMRTYFGKYAAAADARPSPPKPKPLPPPVAAKKAEKAVAKGPAPKKVAAKPAAKASPKPASKAVAKKPAHKGSSKPVAKAAKSAAPKSKKSAKKKR